MMSGEAKYMSKLGGKFRTTPWTAIEEVLYLDDKRSRFILNELVATYWRPVYCYLRQKGYTSEQSKDLTQAFFCDVVVNRKLVQRARRRRGKFRTFLLTALDRYLASSHQKKTAQKRMPKGKLIGIEQLGSDNFPEPSEGLTSQEYFNYAWVSDILDRVLEEVESDCRSHGLEVHWRFFQDRVLKPITEGTASPSMAETCEKHGVPDLVRASNMIVTVKRRCQAALRRHLRESVASDAEVNEERQELLRFLSGDAQGA